MREYYRVQANINLDAICSNIENIRAKIKDGTKIMAVIKADGYGHGAVPVAKALDDRVDAFGISVVHEGFGLREAGLTKPILILGVTPKEYISTAIEYNIMQTVVHVENAVEISKEAKKKGVIVPIHIKIDTGMSRIGFDDSDESVQIIEEIYQLENIEINGIFTHFACADMQDKTFVNEQYKRFVKFLDKLEERGIIIPIKHASNSAGMIDLPEADFDMVRCGIATYGLYPSEDVNKENLELIPSLELKSNIVFLKEVEAGVGIGYGSTYVTSRRMKVATIPVGYGDGYPRRLSSKGRVLINGVSAPIIGLICMDLFMVDVTHIKGVKETDTVTLVGKDGEESISVEEIAELAGSFNYEFICGLGKRIPRVYFKGGKKVGTLDFFHCLKETLELL